jgi:hypothetical protein
MITDSHLEAQRLLTECFSEDEMAFLLTLPEFAQAAAQADDLDSGLEVLTLGARLIQQHRPTFNRARPAGPLLGKTGPERARM